MQRKQRCKLRETGKIAMDNNGYALEIGKMSAKVWRNCGDQTHANIKDTQVPRYFGYYWSNPEPCAKAT